MELIWDTATYRRYSLYIIWAYYKRFLENVKEDGQRRRLTVSVPGSRQSSAATAAVERCAYQNDEAKKLPWMDSALGVLLDGFCRQGKLLRHPCVVISQNGSAIITRAKAIAKALRTFLGFCDNNCRRIQINPITE